MYYIAVGSRSGTEKGRITLLTFDPVSGLLSDYSSIEGVTHPAYQLWDESTRTLYTVAEREEGAVVGYALDASLQPTEVFRSTTEGSSPCHLAFKKETAELAVSNYGGGSMLLIKVSEEAAQKRFFAQYTGSGPVQGRQEASHVHSTLFSEHKDALMVADLGSDALYYYEEKMQRCRSIPTPAGAGPRHMVYSADERYLFVSAELSNEVLVYEMNEEPKLIQQISTLGAGFEGENTTSHIARSRDGKLLYVANRGHDSLAIFAIKDGLLTRKGHAFVERVPWNFAFSKDEKFMIVANHDSDSVTVYPRDLVSGALGPMSSRISVTRPSCITLLTAL